MRNKPLKICQRLVNFCQRGEIIAIFGHTEGKYMLAHGMANAPLTLFFLQE